MESIAPLWLWVVFVAIVIAALFIDFVVLSKQGSHVVGVKEALRWSLVWVALSFMFNALFWWAVKDTTGSSEIANEKALEFLTGYLIEKSLAVDNIFVFLLIFTYFAVPAEFQKRVLMIGILGAIVLRTVMILVGGWLISEFHWLLYVFGAFLVLTGVAITALLGAMLLIARAVRNREDDENQQSDTAAMAQPVRVQEMAAVAKVPVRQLSLWQRARSVVALHDDKGHFRAAVLKPLGEPVRRTPRPRQ